MPAWRKALRFTSANRTCKSTWLLGDPDGSCSMLTIELLGNAARAISAARSITSLPETEPDRMTEFSVSETLMSSPRNSS